MKRFAKRCLAMMLSIILVFSVTPIDSYAAETSGTYVQINTIDELTSGKYVMIVNSGFAVGVFDGSWLGATAVTPTDGKVTNPDSTLVWDMTVSETGVTLTDANGITVKPRGGNENGIASGAYIWAVEFNGTFSFKGIGIDTVTLASNSSITYQNKFRAYKNTTVASYSASYPSAFTLYKLDNSTPPVTPKAAAPTANIPSGTVSAGTAIELSCGTPGASIHYATESPAVSWMDYTEPILINSNITIYAQATAADYEDSDIAEFNYVIEQTDPTIFDPITTIPEGAKSVLDAAQTAAGQVITVVGQLVYRYGNYDTPNTAILEDVIDGKIYALQIYNALSEFSIGDIVKLTGTTSVYGGVPQVQNLTSRELVTPAAGTQLINVQEFASITELKGSKDTLLSEWVVIRNVTLGTYSGSGSTTVTDSNGDTIQIYRAATYPSGVAAGDKVDLYAYLNITQPISFVSVSPRIML